MTCRTQALPPGHAARTKAEATEILGDPNASLSLKRLAWRFLKDERRDWERCPRCNGTGAIDAPWSGSDPSCPECDGEGKIYD